MYQCYEKLIVGTEIGRKSIIPGSIRTQFFFSPSPQLLYLALSVASFLPVATLPPPHRRLCLCFQPDTLDGAGNAASKEYRHVIDTKEAGGSLDESKSTDTK